MPALTPPPTAPSTSRPTTFSSEADAFIAWQINSLVPYLNALGTPGLGGGILLAALENAADIVIPSVAGITDIGAAASNDVIISGSLTMTGLGATASKAKRRILTTGAPVFTNNANIITGTNRDIQAAPGDVFDWYRDATGVWRLEGAMLAGGPLLSAFSSSGVTAAYTQIASLAFTPGRWKCDAFMSSRASTLNDLRGAISSTTASNAGTTSGQTEVSWGPSSSTGIAALIMPPSEIVVTANQNWFFNARGDTISGAFSGRFRAERVL